jgi:hypothetical protein
VLDRSTLLDAVRTLVAGNAVFGGRCVDDLRDVAESPGKPSRLDGHGPDL